MATVAILGVCSGGDHVRVRVTLAGGRQVERTVSVAEARQVLDDVGKEEFILRQLAAVVRDNPGATQQQLRTLIEARNYQE